MKEIHIINAQEMYSAALEKLGKKVLGTLYDERQGADYDFFQHS